MRYRIRDIPELLKTPIGRHELVTSAQYAAWPLYRIVARIYRRQMLRETRISVVIGSLGKSTTVRALKAAFTIDMKGPVSENAYSGLATSLLRIGRSSRFGVLEAGIDRVGQMAQYANMIQPDVVVVTSLASDHDETFSSFNRKRDEKTMMVRAIADGGLVVLNGDDPNVLWMRTRTNARVVTYGFGPDSDVRAKDLEFISPEEGMRFTVLVGSECKEMQTRLLGRHMVYSILAAMAVGFFEGISLDNVTARLEALKPSPQRLETAMLSGGACMLRDDYKASSESMTASLDTLAALPARRRFAVLGEVSDVMYKMNDIYKHLGKAALNAADHVMFVGGEKAFNIFRAGAAETGASHEKLRYAGNNAFNAIQMLPDDLSSGDLILVNGVHHMRMDRICLALTGNTVRCRVRKCTSLTVRCGQCRMLDQNWCAETAPV